jgi:DNA gyrase subunit A
MPVDGIRRMGRATQGVTVMRLRGDELVSSLAPVVESEEPDAPAAADAPGEPAAEFDEPDAVEADDDEADDDEPDDEPDDDE